MDAVLSFNKVSPKSILAHNKITTFLSFAFGADILDSQEKLTSCMMRPYQRIFIVNGLECFCDYREQAYQFLNFQQGKKMYWCTNDYAIKPGKQVREAMEKSDTTLLSTVDEGLHNQKFYKRYQYVNWNSLTTNMSFDYKRIGKQFDIVYYGAYREGREEYFAKYMPSSLYKMRVSTTRSNVDKFLTLGDDILFYPPFTWDNVISELCFFKYSIYLEDKASNKYYCSPANRFYECISNGVVLLFDASTKDTFDRAGIDISGYIVNSQAELANAMKEIDEEYQKHQETQHLWIKDYRNEIREQIAKL